MNLIQKLGQVDNRVIYVLLIVVLMWPLLAPIGLPISISPYTQKTFDVISALKPGDTVLYCAGYSVAGAGDVQAQAVAITRHLLSKGVKIIYVTDVVEGPMVIERTLMAVPEAQGLTYGVDWCDLGYLAGAENAHSAMARGLRDAYPSDYHGNATDSLPIMAGIDTAGDVAMYIFFTTQNSDMFVRQIYPYGVPIVGGLISTIVPQAEPYVNSGQLAGILAGLRGGAEYETLMKQPSIGVAAMDAQSVGHLLFIVFIAFANIAYFSGKRQGGAKGGVAR